MKWCFAHLESQIRIFKAYANIILSGVCSQHITSLWFLVCFDTGLVVMSDSSQLLALLSVICFIPCWFLWTCWGPCRVTVINACGTLRGSHSCPGQFRCTETAFPAGLELEPGTCSNRFGFSLAGSRTLYITNM